MDSVGGWLFGSGSKNDVVDRRLPRDPIGAKFWEKWDQVYGDGGEADPATVYAKAMQSLNQSPISLNFGGQSFSVQPRSAQRQAQAYMGLLGPWMEGGMELERGRYGQPYHDPATGVGMVGNLILDGNKGIAQGIGKGIGAAMG
jgi:hypothetical protein